MTKCNYLVQQYDICVGNGGYQYVEDECQMHSLFPFKPPPGDVSHHGIEWLDAGPRPATYSFTFSHLADAFIQSDLHMCHLQCIHILHFTFTLMAHCTSGAIRGSVPCSRTLRQGIELATF